jgi:hypothetical protein
MKTTRATLMLLALASVAAAAGPGPGVAEVRAVRAASPVVIDGVISESAWQSAPVAAGFRQQRPNEGSDPTQRTEVRVLYDDQALYVAARMFDARADSIVRTLARRDYGMRSDVFTLFLDPQHDRRSGYFFGLSAAGTLYDGTLQNDIGRNSTWDGVWEGRTKVDGDGWTAELRIPFSQLRFARADVQEWGINFERSMGRGFEENYLAYTPANESGFVSRFPALTGLAGVSPGRAIEVMPYGTSRAEYLQHEPLDPFNDGSRLAPNVGGDLRMPLGTRLALNATVNPDFGQVEVDPAVVNLSDVETFFPEKRPFFVEGNSIFNAGQQGASNYWGFDFPQPTFFYSRRIGRAPAGSLPEDARFSDVPNGTTILGAAKVSGKLGSAADFGMLHAVTARERADLLDGGFSRVNGFEVEPLTYYGVGRVLKEYPERRHGIGVISTLAARNFESRRLEDEFNRASFTTAVDGWHFLDAKQVWVLSGWAGGTHVTGSPARIEAIQRSSRHYFQRPDAKSYEVDPAANSMSGLGGRMWLNKEKGNWMSNSSLGFLSPGLEMNDLGYLSQADLIGGHLGGGHKWTKPTRHVKNHNVQGALFGATNFDGDLVSAGAYSEAFWWYKNDWCLDLSATYNPETVQPRRSRGGPLMLSRPGTSGNLFMDTDGSRVRYYYLNLYGSTQPGEGSWNWGLSPGITWKPASNLQFSLGPDFNRSRDGAYYFAALDDAAATSTYGRRYLFTELEQTTLGATVRASISFTPTMSLQFYGQPLLSTGRYRNIKELARPRSLDFIGPGAGAWTYDPATNLFDPDGAGIEEPYSRDFSFRSLRGNAVFRWEYRPGSTLYLVWTQVRSDEEPGSDFNVGPSFRQLMSADADNIFLAKVTYYLNL